MLRERLRSALQNFLREDEKPSSKTESSSLEMELETCKRKADQYFKKIEGVIAEREVWKNMFFEQGSAHQNAQALMEEEIIKVRSMVGLAVTLVNEYRGKTGSLKLEYPFKELTDPPVGRKAEFEKLLQQLKSVAPPEVDHLAERDQILNS